MWGRASSVEEHSSARYVARRKSRRRRLTVAIICIVCVIGGAFLYGIWQPPVRISRVTVYGADQSLAEIALEAMRGTYLGIIPRDSTFFFPADRIHTDITKVHPDIATVSFFRSGLSGLSIKIDYRIPIARWSAVSEMGTSTEAEYYYFDASGFIYATTSDAELINSFIIYEPLGDKPVPGGIIGSTLPKAEKFPSVFDLAREVATFGAPVTSIHFHDDEVDMYVASSTRITYVLGNEEHTLTALASARANFDLTNNSIEYIDARFPGKVYVKKKKNND